MRKDVVFNMFTNKVKFVKPLYKRDRHINEDKTKILAIKFDSSINLRGDDIYVDRNLNAESEINATTINKSFKNKNQGIALPGVCESGFGNVKGLKLNKFNGNVNNKKSLQGVNRSVFEVANKRKYNKMIENESDHHTDGNTLKKIKQLDVNSKPIVLHKFSDTWLRVYPAPVKQGESSCSVAIRCVFCQLGLTAILVIWNIIWVFIINSFEGPQEVKVALEFDKEQNQLIIDLATELRQIQPLSSKWREAIEKRIEDERRLTMQAVGEGAKPNPGLFWNLSGTFLFSVYVMTALGFGAPVPHTICGRISALVYAILAVPTHIYLMWNVSTCIVVSIEQHTKKMKRIYCAQKKTTGGKLDLGSINGNGRFCRISYTHFYSIIMFESSVCINKSVK
ncbi:unnamed protein product [Parnassius mnemosyne]|uniref:Potassium channel domain-containing protein n=1 Tax=Parnassius mnemosyne TaxID=213953 RepID=A0AAV1L516_9NEOP